MFELRRSIKNVVPSTSFQLDDTRSFESNRLSRFIFKPRRSIREIQLSLYFMAQTCGRCVLKHVAGIQTHSHVRLRSTVQQEEFSCCTLEMWQKVFCSCSKVRWCGFCTKMNTVTNKIPLERTDWVSTCVSCVLLFSGASHTLFQSLSFCSVSGFPHYFAFSLNHLLTVTQRMHISLTLFFPCMHSRLHANINIYA